MEDDAFEAAKRHAQPPPDGTSRRSFLASRVGGPASPAGVSVMSEMPKRGKVKSIFTDPLAMPILPAVSTGEGSIACFRAAICAAFGAGGLPWDTQTGYASPCVSSTRRWLTHARLPKPAGTVTVIWMGVTGAATRSSW